MVAFSFSFHVLVPPTFLLVFLLLFILPPFDHNNFTNLFSSSISFSHVKTRNEKLSLLPPTPPPVSSLTPPLHATINERINESIVRTNFKKNNLEKIEQGLARARKAIRDAVRYKNYTSYKEETFIPRGSIYRNSYAFHQSHIEMEKRFRVWIYKEGDQPLVHGGPLNNIYGIEGQFIDEMVGGKSRFMARHPDEAHVFFLPISVAKIISFVYKPLVTYDRDQLQRLVSDYIAVVADKYPFWNRSFGADHFMVSCHDWAPDISTANPDLYKNFIRALCNANTSERFRPERDVSIPEINIPVGKLGPPHRDQSPAHRPILAFFAGGAHGPIRKALLHQWKAQDNEIQVHEYLPKKSNYFKLMGRAQYCLCPSGYEVASPRVVTSIAAGCVPVIISDHYALPFSDVLDWKKFSVHIPSEKIPEIKNILKGISHKKYLKMQRKVKKVQQHFVVNRPSRPYDVIRMILHSVWLRRLNFQIQL